MKRDLDLLRDILLAAEAVPTSSRISHRDFKPLGVTREALGAHVRLLSDASFVEASVGGGEARSDRRWTIYRITMAGHDYLDSVRSPEVYRETKSRLDKIGGTASLEVVKSVAGAIARSMMGLDP